MALSKGQRLQIFFDRLRTLKPASTADAARRKIDDTLVAVEDEFSDVPASHPPPATDDGRMYPALPDRTRNLGDILAMDHRRHVTYLGRNGAILIISRSDGKVLAQVAGADGVTSRLEEIERDQ